MSSQLHCVVWVCSYYGFGEIFCVHLRTTRHHNAEDQNLVKYPILWRPNVVRFVSSWNIEPEFEGIIILRNVGNYFPF
jgi:hypothetical protein